MFPSYHSTVRYLARGRKSDFTVCTVFSRMISFRKMKADSTLPSTTIDAQLYQFLLIGPVRRKPLRRDRNAVSSAPNPQENSLVSKQEETMIGLSIFVSLAMDKQLEMFNYICQKNHTSKTQ